MEIEQITEQRDFVSRAGECNCIVYHPVGEEYQRVFKEWVRTGRSNMVMVAQLFSECHTRQVGSVIQHGKDNLE